MFVFGGIDQNRRRRVEFQHESWGRQREVTILVGSGTSPCDATTLRPLSTGPRPDSDSCLHGRWGTPRPVEGAECGSRDTRKQTDPTLLSDSNRGGVPTRTPTPRVTSPPGSGSWSPSTQDGHQVRLRGRPPQFGPTSISREGGQGHEVGSWVPGPFRLVPTLHSTTTSLGVDPVVVVLLWDSPRLPRSDGTVHPSTPLPLSTRG